MILDPSKPNQKYFEAISAIPRGSMHEKAISDYVLSCAQKQGLFCIQDGLWNVVVKKPASPGYESAPAVMLQAHMDMVCVKSPDSTHDFERDPLKLYVDENGLLRAEGTTLGSDDGYGVAYLLSVMEEDFPHPPLELVFTVQEENGCYGAAGLDTAQLSARRMIGLDVGGDIENECVTGCYFSDKMVASRLCQRETATGNCLAVKVSGITPFRDGALVHPELYNAVKLLARVLNAAGDIRLIRMSGGEAENYNPVSAEAVLVCADADATVHAMEKAFSEACRETDDGRQKLKLEICASHADTALTGEETRRILDLLTLMPSNVCTLDVQDATMTSINNIGIVSLEEGQFTLVMSDRARREHYKKALLTKVATICRLCGMALDTTVRYASWEYRPDSPLLKTTAALMKEFYGQPMREAICPGGLECCDLIPKMPGLDVVMFAPISGGFHSTAEFLNLASFDRVYEFLKLLLGKLTK